MKRLLSWIVVYLLSTVFYFVSTFVVTFLASLSSYVTHWSTIIFWLVILGGGSFLIFLIVYAVMGSVQLVLNASQGLCHSVNGTRYKVAAILTIIFWGFNLVATMYQVIQHTASNIFISIVESLVMLGFSICLMSMGKERVLFDGPPLSERERLQAKLDALDAKEGRK